MKTAHHSELRSLTTRVVSAGEALWQAGAERRAAWLARGFATLADETSALHKAALEDVPVTSQLSPQMVRWAITSTLAPLTQQALLALEASAPRPNPRATRARAGQLCVVVLAGNVFTAAVKAVGVPLLFGLPVLAKSPSGDSAFLRLLQRALSMADAQLGEAFQAVSFASQDEEQTHVLFEQADVVCAYGSDSTLNAIRAQLSATVSFVGHGHGLGAAFIGGAALREPNAARRAAHQLAFDIAAYDQRGCLSPLVAWVERGQRVDPEQFAQLLHEAMNAVEQELPRGGLPIDAASAQVSFRGIAAMRGTLLEGAAHAVAYEAEGPLRISPGYRNIQLLSIESADALCERLAPLSVHLKCLGVAGHDPKQLIPKLPTRVAPRICPLGAMQTPKSDALHDGIPVWEGLLRYTEHDA